MGEKGVVRKIKFARRWLEKAEEAYLQGKSEEGFLSLSLAEAEIRALHRGEWEKALKLKKSPLRVIFEVSLLVVLLVLTLTSYPYVESFQEIGGRFSISSNLEYRLVVGCSKSFHIYVDLPHISLNAHCRGSVGLYNKKGLDAHILYVIRREKVRDREEKALRAEEKHALSAEELIRLIELGRKEFKIYLTGGR